MPALQDVFGIANSVNVLSYVDRGGLDERFRYVLSTERHIAIHGDSKQGKSWLREHALPEDESMLVQCVVDTTPETILTSALGQLGVRAELRRTAGNELEGRLDLTAAGKLGLSFLAKVEVEGAAGGTIGKTTEVESEPVGQTPGDLSWVARVLRESGRRLVVEDFHYVSEPNQRAFAFMLKALGEYGVFPIIVGIWPQDHLLTYYNGDLEGRVEDIQLTWSEEELRGVLEKGAEALNISFHPGLVTALVGDAYGNVGLLQRLAEQICLQNGVVSTQEERRQLELGPTLEKAQSAVADAMRGRFQAFADNFVRGMRRMPEGLEVYKHLLQTVSEMPDNQLLDGIDSADLLGRIGEHGDTAIRASDLTQALDRIDRLQVKIAVSPPVLTYNRHSRRIFLGDRSFLFFRKYGDPRWPWAEGEEPLVNDLAVAEPLTFDDL